MLGINNMLGLKNEDFSNDYKVINNIRCLAIDMIDNANSGHPGICLGASPMLYTLFSRHLNIYPKDALWYNRDRFILSAGHGAPMLYATLYMLGYLTLDDCKNLRKLNSNTPGHPEIETLGVDMSTGPLGQGIGTSVGMAMAERYLNTLNKNLFNHYTYVLCGDGDLMEGVSYEALSLAGKLKLNKLILLYDSNNVTLDSDLERSSDEDIITRFKAINFDIFTVSDGENIKEIDNAIKRAKESIKPSIIIVKTKIGKHSINEGKNITHGKPLDKEDISSIKNKLDIYDTSFTVSNDAVEYFQKTLYDRVNYVYKDWKRKFANLKESEQERFNKIIEGKNSYEIKDMDIPYEDLSLRDISGKILNKIANDFELVIGGSADLSSSCKTNLVDLGIFDSGNYHGRNIYFGIREHAMGAILNGMALCNLRPFGSTFLVFSDYLRPAIRMSALMDLPVTYIFTHDSITVGEDGKTHQPIEQLYSLDLIPNLQVYHPFDVNELISCYKEIYKNKKSSVLVLPRDNKQVSELTKSNKINKGAYILKKEETDNFIILLGSGEVIGTLIEVSDELKIHGIDTRIISLPCYKNFIEQEEKYINDLLPNDRKIIGVSYSVSDRFYRFTNKVIGVNTFGISAPKGDLLNYFSLTKEQICEQILKMIEEDNHE